MATADELGACLCQLTARDVVVDLAEVAFMDSCSLNALVQARNVLRDAGGSLRVTGERDIVRTVLEVTGLLEVFRGDDDRPAD